MGLADGLDTYIGTEALNYITDTSILLKVALGRSRFSRAAAERIEEEEALKEIVQNTKPKDEAYSVACRKLEDIRIAALESLDESALKETALNDPSLRVRVEAVRYIKDQDFLEALTLSDEPDICAAAVRRVIKWAPLLALARNWRVSLDSILERLCSGVFLEEREAIIAAAAPEMRSGDAEGAPRFAAIIAKLTGKSMNDVYLQYGGMEYVQKQIDKLLGCSELQDFKDARSFLCYAYGKSRECQDALKNVGRRTLSKHYDYNPGCFSERCDVTVEKTIDFESEMNA
jgi:predicted nucleic acid-binding protein